MTNITMVANVKLNNNAKLVGFADVVIKLDGKDFMRLFGIKIWNNSLGLSVEFLMNENKQTGRKYPITQFGSPELRNSVVEAIKARFNELAKDTLVPEKA